MVKHDINTIPLMTLNVIFNYTPSQNILNFIKKVNLYDQL